VRGWEEKWFVALGFDWSSPSPITDGLPPDGGVWRRLCREPEGNGTPKGARACVSSTAGTRQGTDGFLGHERCQGQTSGLEVGRQGGRDPDGWMVRRSHGRHCAQENRDASAATSQGEYARRNATEKSCQKWCKGEVWPLDGSLLMGVFLCAQGLSVCHKDNSP
jgi:hypothetical protein